eukprot:CAMPEP_0206168172 /NCGR_PEP_ID=MMETSP1474-20131121/31114_1 /ASSEMBLY_ACC=CAM_ASM_001110 /TAXON_ID=97495 /ORGANISM="Imantonia sp., Strain RCC918" /LENGTH=155 /DNA_ID=CAMNT_0053573357 /DNA_START=25 /DNA_END=489 /DNA_ORIENTATION=+
MTRSTLVGANERLLYALNAGRAQLRELGDAGEGREDAAYVGPVGAALPNRTDLPQRAALACAATATRRGAAHVGAGRRVSADAGGAEVVGCVRQHPQPKTTEVRAAILSRAEPKPSEVSTSEILDCVSICTSPLVPLAEKPAMQKKKRNSRFLWG